MNYEEEMNRQWHDGYEHYYSRNQHHKMRQHPQCPFILRNGHQCKNTISYRQKTCYTHRHMLSIPFLNEEALHREIQRQWDILPLEQQHFVCELYKMMHLFDPWHSEHTSFLLEILLAHWNDEHFRKRIFSRPSVATDPEKRGPW